MWLVALMAASLLVIFGSGAGALMIARGGTIKNAIRLHPLRHILRPNLKLQVISTVTVHSGNNLASALRTGSGGGLGDPGVPAKGWVAMILPFPGRSGVP